MASSRTVYYGIMHGLISWKVTSLVTDHREIISFGTHPYTLHVLCTVASEKGIYFVFSVRSWCTLEIVVRRIRHQAHCSNTYDFISTGYPKRHQMLSSHTQHVFWAVIYRQRSVRAVRALKPSRTTTPAHQLDQHRRRWHRRRSWASAWGRCRPTGASPCLWWTRPPRTRCRRPRRGCRA